MSRSFYVDTTSAFFALFRSLSFHRQHHQTLQQRTAMDWRTLAETQRKQLEHNSTAIDQLNRHVGDLQFKLAEQAEELKSNANHSEANDQLSKLKLRVQIAENRQTELTTQKEAAESALARAKTHERELQTQVGELQVQLTKERTQQERLKKTAQSLQGQLQAEKEASATSRAFAPYSKHRDEDDEEPNLPVQTQFRRPTAQPAAPNSTQYGPPPTATKKTSSPAKQQLASQPAQTRILKLPLRPVKEPIAPTSKGKPAKKDFQQPTQNNRKRSFEEDLDGGLLQKEIDDEVRGLDLKNVATHIAPRKKQRVSYSDLDASPDFEFLAVTGYDADGSISGYDSEKDLKGVMTELWDRVGELTDLCEEARGQRWQEVFDTKSRTKHCVARKMEGGRVQWRAGCEGKFACRDCVREERPCFTWSAERVESDFEIRYWINA